MVLNFVLNICTFVTILWVLNLFLYVLREIVSLIYHIFLRCTNKGAVDKFVFENPFQFLSLREEGEKYDIVDGKVVKEKCQVYKKDSEIIINITMSVMAILGLIRIAEESGIWGLVFNY